MARKKRVHRSDRGSTSLSDSPAAALWLIGGSVVFVVAMLVYSAMKDPPLTEVELLLFQIVIFGLGMAGSYLFGRSSAEQAARDVVRPHAISAFRRVVSLYEALRRFVVTIENQRSRLVGGPFASSDERIPSVQVDSAMELFIVQITEQIGTANDAVDDWRDIVPDEVERVEKALQQRRQAEESHERK